METGTYWLAGVIVHTRADERLKTIGHYMCYLRESGTWYKCNDSAVPLGMEPRLASGANGGTREYAEVLLYVRGTAQDTAPKGQSAATAAAQGDGAVRPASSANAAPREAEETRAAEPGDAIVAYSRTSSTHAPLTPTQPARAHAH